MFTTFTLEIRYAGDPAELRPAAHAAGAYLFDLIDPKAQHALSVVVRDGDGRIIDRFDHEGEEGQAHVPEEGGGSGTGGA